MKICVLAAPDAWHYLDLKRAAGAKHIVECVSFERLTDIVGDEETTSRHPLQQFDCLFARAMPYGSLQQVIFRMDVLLELQQRGMRVVNPPRTIEMAVDKYLSLAHLSRNGIPVPRTAVSQTFSDAMKHFEMLGGDVVMKPLFGSMGRGLERITSLKMAEKQFLTALTVENVIYQQTFIDHGGFDLRLLVIGDDVLAMKRVNTNDWITNIAQGATGHPYQPTESERQIAIAAARAVGAEIAGVDLACDVRTKQPFVLEVNSAPSWQATSQVLEIDIAQRILNYLQ